MKLLKKNQLYTKSYFLLNIGSTRWGCANPFEVKYFYRNSAILDLKLLFIRLKKILSITNYIAFNQGICLTFFLDIYKKGYYNELNFNQNKNFYIAFINKMFGFLSNFYFFLKTNTTKTNYKSYRLPSLVFMTKGVWKNFNNFFRVFLTLKILNIKSCKYLDCITNASYNVWIGKCNSLFNMLKSIYFLNNLYIKKW